MLLRWPPDAAIEDSEAPRGNRIVSDSSPRHPLEAAHARVTRRLALRHGLSGAAACALLIAASIAFGAAVPLGPGGAWVRLVATLTACAAATLLGVRGFLAVRPRFHGWVEQVERAFPEVRSWLRNALELNDAATVHTSPELAGAVRDEATRRLARVPLGTLTPGLEPRRPAWMLGASLAGVALLAVAAPQAVSRSWQTLVSPAAAAPEVRLEVVPGSTRVAPGGSLTVRARVWGTAAKPRLQRGGPRVEAAADGVDAGAHTWRFELVQLTRAEDYRVKVAGVQSPRYRITLAGDPQPVSFDITYRTPGYAHLPDQHGVTTRGDLSALRGTRAEIEASFDRDLESVSAMLPGGATSAWRRITPRRWRGEVPIQGDGDWTLAARASEGAGSFRYHVTAVPDAPPVLAVRLPEGSMDLPTGQQVALDLDGQDDLGLSELSLEWRKGADTPWRVLPLAGLAGLREAHVQRQWDASGLGLLPGETVTFRFALWDDDAFGRNVARSGEFELRFPSMAQLYDQVENQQTQAQTSLEQVQQQAKELQKSLDQMAHQAPSPSSSSQPQSFERKEEMQKALDRQQALSKQIDQATQQLRESLDRAAERHAFDEQLTRKLQEMAQLLDQIQSKEFKDALKKMQDALQQLDRRTADQNLEQWRQQNQELMKNLERTIELMKQLREDEHLQALAQRAQELAKQQQNLAQSMQPSPKEQAKALADQQRETQKQTEELSKDAQQTGKESKLDETRKALEQAAQELTQQAQPEQQQAADQAEQQQSSAAKSSATKAGESLQRAAQQLSSLAQQHQDQQDQLDLATLRRAAKDLVSLQREAQQNADAQPQNSQNPSNAQPQNSQSSQNANDPADKQSDLAEGASRVADSLYHLSERQPFITPKLASALGRAIQQLNQSGQAMQQNNREAGQQMGRSASEALNEAVLELRHSENSMCNKPGSKPGGRKPGSNGSLPMQMQALGEQQGQLNQESRSLSKRLSEQMRLSAGDRNEMQRMAEEQQRIREQLQEIQREDEAKKQLLGRLDQAQHDMKDVEEALRQGRSGDDVEEKQERILSRLLDAQRSVNRRDFDPERESRPGVDIVRASPAQLPADLMREHDRLRLDLLKAEADRYPAQYRALIEAYLRSLNGSRR